MRYINKRIYKQKPGLINWCDENIVPKSHYRRLKVDDFYSLLNSQNPDKKIGVNWCRMTEWYSRGCWHLRKKNNYYYILYTYELGGWFIYTCNIKDDNKNVENINDLNIGTLSFKHVSQKFKERNGVGFQKAFGIVEANYKECIPKSFYYCNPLFFNKVINHVSAVDFCSQYPSNLCGILPDAHDKIISPGRIKPNKDYPFAFYINSGELAEFDIENNKLRYDTGNWKYSIYRTYLYKDNKKFINADDEITVLMKASQYQLTEEMNNLYDMRYKFNNKEDVKKYKLMMNSFIGTLHKSNLGNYNRNPYAHLAAVAITRGNEKIREFAENLKEPVLQIIVDSVITNSDKEYGKQEKKLGSLHQEFTDCDFLMTGCNQYIAMKDNNLVKYAHSACNVLDNGIKIDDNYSPTCFEDIYRWKRDMSKQEEIQIKAKLFEEYL